MKVIALVASFLLVGCITPISGEEKAVRAIAKHGPYCEKLGFTANTDPWRDCIVRAQGDLERNVLTLTSPR